MMQTVYSTESISVSRAAAPQAPACLARIRRLPSEGEAHEFVRVLRSSVYDSLPEGFLLVYDLAELEITLEESNLCYERALLLASFYNQADMKELRLRASEVIIVTQSQPLRCILDMIMSVYPSPVKVSCRDSMASVALPATGG